MTTAGKYTIADAHYSTLVVYPFVAPGFQNSRYANFSDSKELHPSFGPVHAFHSHRRPIVTTPFGRS